MGDEAGSLGDSGYREDGEAGGICLGLPALRHPLLVTLYKPGFSEERPGEPAPCVWCARVPEEPEEGRLAGINDERAAPWVEVTGGVLALLKLPDLVSVLWDAFGKPAAPATSCATLAKIPSGVMSSERAGGAPWLLLLLRIERVLLGSIAREAGAAGLPPIGAWTKFERLIDAWFASDSILKLWSPASPVPIWLTRPEADPEFATKKLDPTVPAVLPGAIPGLPPVLWVWYPPRPTGLIVTAGAE